VEGANLACQDQMAQQGLLEHQDQGENLVLQDQMARQGH
jgi:hypothetical protein